MLKIGFFSEENKKPWDLLNQRNGMIGLVFKSICEAVALDSKSQK